MATPGSIVNLSQYVGTDRPYSDSIVDVNGAAVNITGWLVTFTVHEYGNPNNVYIIKTVGNGITLDTPVGGPYPSIVTVTVAAADTANMFPGEYQYTIVRTNTGADDVPTSGLFTLLSL